MLLSISNSKQNKMHWFKVWALVLSICSVTLISYTVFLDKKGFSPTVETNKDLWSWYRSKVYQKNVIVLLGASRSLLGMNITTIKTMFPSYEVLQLSLSGKYPIGTLLEIADDPNFQGNIIISIKAEAFNDAYFKMQEDYYNYYKNNSTYYRSLNAYLTAYLQSKFVILNTSLGLQNIVENFTKKRVFIEPKFVIGDLDLSISADFLKINASKRAERYADLSKNYLVENGATPPENMIKNFAPIKNAIMKIKARNGQVIFLRMPTDDALWEIDEQYFPRKLYWDKFMSLLNTDSIHFKDIAGLDKFDLPDNSHLDKKNSVEFTTILFQYIQDKDLLK